MIVNVAPRQNGREGQHRGEDTIVWVKRVPCSSNQNRVLGIAAIVPLN